MNAEKVMYVKIEINRLLHRIAVYEQQLDSGPKETGAVRRASMDLTRALAELRKP